MTKKIAVFPRIVEFSDQKAQVGYSIGWLFEGNDSKYAWVFGLSKTREEALESMQRKHPDVEVVQFDEELPSRNQKRMRIKKAQYDDLMVKFEEALLKKKSQKGGEKNGTSKV